jgi:ubiquinone/menaquinone biosynthesis C-methylase UbiE
MIEIFKAEKAQDKEYELRFWKDWCNRYGYYAAFERSEYEQILVETGITEESPPSRLLELACGSGAYTRDLAKHFNSIVAIDLSPDLIAAAKEYAQIGNVTYLVGDMEHLDFADESFDVIFVGGGFHHCHLILDRVIAECNRVLVNGGRIYLCEPAITNIQNMLTFYFALDASQNECALSPKGLRKRFLRHGFTDFAWHYITNPINVFPPNYDTTLQRSATLLRLIKCKMAWPFAAFYYAFIHQSRLAEYLPPRFFVASATKMGGDQCY